MRVGSLSSEYGNPTILAIYRFGGTQLVASKAGLVPFREWIYVEGMYEFLLGLKGYLDQYHRSDYKTFPVASTLKL